MTRPAARRSRGHRWLDVLTIIALFFVSAAMGLAQWEFVVTSQLDSFSDPSSCSAAPSSNARPCSLRSAWKACIDKLIDGYASSRSCVVSFSTSLSHAQINMSSAFNDPSSPHSALSLAIKNYSVAGIPVLQSKLSMELRGSGQVIVGD